MRHLVEGLVDVMVRGQSPASVLPQIGVYATSKAAVVQMTRALALEWGRFGINVVTGNTLDEVEQMGVVPEGYAEWRYDYADEAAFELLYQRYVRSVFGLALRRLGDRGPG